MSHSNRAIRIGSRVEVSLHTPGGPMLGWTASLRGKIGKVVGITNGNYAVDFGKRIGRATHSCDGFCPDETGRWFYLHEFIVKPNKKRKII